MTRPPEPDASTRGSSAARRGPAILGVVVLVALGAFLGGIIGGLAAVAALSLARWRGYRFVAACALAVLVVAAVLSLVEAPADAHHYIFHFAEDRPLAAEAGRIAGVFVMIFLALAAWRERTPRHDDGD